jgi:1,6-anhydro-N-acetylmuramate kinase
MLRARYRIGQTRECRMTTLQGALADLLQSDELSVDDAATRHIGPEFRQRVNGDWADRAEFLDGIPRLRRETQSITVTVVDEFVDGLRYSERHLIELVYGDGRRLVHEVYLFATLDAQGRFTLIEEMTRAVHVRVITCRLC